MEFELKEVPTITLKEESIKKAVKDLSGNAFKLFISIAVLNMEDWYESLSDISHNTFPLRTYETIVVPGNDTLNEAFSELSSKGYITQIGITQDGKLSMSCPDLCVSRGTTQSKFIKNYKTTI